LARRPKKEERKERKAFIFLGHRILEMGKLMIM
jgi:hypothetical protein